MSHEEILVPAESADGSWNMRWRLQCPACGSDAVDRVDETGDHEAVTVQPDRDDYESPLGNRGGYVRVDLTCSDGHGFAFIMGNHKGAEFVGVVPRV
jgi:hypothetical protein